MVNRTSSKDSVIGIASSGFFSHRRTDDFNNADLFSRSRPDESDLQVRLPRISAKPAKIVLDDLLSSNQGGKHDYDWLLTPPGTPLFPTSDGKESQQISVAPRSNSSVRSGSTVKTSRLSVSQSESSQPSKLARSRSVTRSSNSTTQYTSYSNRNTNILNTSSASVSSYIRPSTPTNRSSSTIRPSTASTRTPPSRASTPSRSRPSSTTTSVDSHRTTRPSQNPRPSTPTSPTIRSSTPTHRSPTPSLAPSATSSPSAARALSSNGHRPSSPVSRVRPPPQPILLPDFPLETPPNLRTSLSDRPLSAGRSRPGAAMTVNSTTITRRHSSPIATRGRLTDPSGRARPHVAETLESRRTSHMPESLTRKPIKSSTSESGAGFGRSISKKSLDMAIKHMDIRNGGIRPISGSTLFPQSIRSGRDGVGSRNGNYSGNKGKPVEHKSRCSSRLAEVDMYESSRYDAILLKEDLKNTNWLRSADENNDEGPLFDNGFETLPEPFGPL